MVADDDPAILRLVKTILEKENYSVVTARDGREAYKILQNDQNFTAGSLRRRDAAHLRTRTGALHEDRKKTDANPGNDDDGGTGSEIIVR